MFVNTCCPQDHNLEGMQLFGLDKKTRASTSLTTFKTNIRNMETSEYNRQ